MQVIDEPRLENDLAYRFGYVAGLMGFGEADIAAIHGAKSMTWLNIVQEFPSVAC